MSMNSVQVRNAAKSYGKKSKKHVVLNNLNMNVPQGSIYCLLGSSGCGKTTLLSSILGMIKLEAGDIKVLGSDKASKVCHRIGYMPQETALVGELTVKETIFYFGNIFQMNLKDLNEHYEMLKSLLELPPDDTRIDTCSGGEMRRISFAAACINDPDLLILDEPTVGLDPLLRDKIWNFLWDVTRTSKLSVIITTHYIAEAQKSDRVGFMRNGALLAEDSPNNILTRYEVDTLDDAFLAMCSNEIPAHAAIQNDTEVTEPTTMNETNFTKEQSSHCFFRWQIVNELAKKHYRKYIRQPSLLLFTLMLPAVQLLLLYNILQSNFLMRVAIANEDVNDLKDCLNASSTTPVISNDVCQVPRASCLFMEAFQNAEFELETFNSYEKAFEQLKHGKVIALVHIKPNFSEAFNEYLKPGHETDNPVTIVMENTEFLIDRTQALISCLVPGHIENSGNLFLRRLVESCDRSSSFLNSPFALMEPIYGMFRFNSLLDASHTFIVVLCIFITSSLTLTPTLTDRKEGLWNRTVLAGVTIREILLAQFITYSVIIFFINFEYIFYSELVYKTRSFESSAKLFLLLTILGWCGMFLGMLLSSICPNVKVANTAMFSITVSLCSICGVFQPIDLCRNFFQNLSKTLPITYPAEAIRDIMVKGYSFSNFSVAMGFTTAIVWAFLAIILTTCVLKRNKFSSNS